MGTVNDQIPAFVFSVEATMTAVVVVLVLFDKSGNGPVFKIPSLKD